MKKKEQAVKVVQKKGAEVATEVIADSIRRIADGMDLINRGALNRKALVTLLKDACNVNKFEIEMVLDSMTNLAKYYTKE